MKTKRAIELAVLMSAAVAFSYWLGYEQGSNSASLRLSAVGSPRGFVRLAPHGRNYLSDRFSITGAVTVPKELKH